MNSVAKGIKLFKENNSDAINHFNKALSIDEENVEALVARGALYVFFFVEFKSCFTTRFINLYISAMPIMAISSRQ